MNRALDHAKELIDFIDQSPSAFHAADNVKKILIKNGFCECKETDHWTVEKGGKYFVSFNDSAVIAFVIGSEDIEQEGFKIVGAHTDSPTFRIKPCPEMIVENYLKLNTEVYGGPILNTWLDRPLSAAGRVIVKGEHPFYPVTKLIHIEQPILMIPNLAIHMNRKVNEGIELNKQKDLLPILGIIDESFEKNNYLLKYLGDVLHMDAKDIIDFDLFLYPVEKSCIMGMNDEFISAPRLDDLAMVHAGIKAICAAKPSRGINVMVCFDNEEIGSSTKQGADSPMLSSVLERIVLALGQNREGYFRSLAHSFMISADMAHAIHPNYIEKQDPTNHPRINEGPVIKISANQKYTTDSYSDSVYEQICRHADIPVQKFVNRSDQPGGSTIGPINAAHMNIRSIDIGNPMLGMHSVRELAGVKDHTYIIKSFESFFEI